MRIAAALIADSSARLRTGSDHRDLSEPVRGRVHDHAGADDSRTDHSSIPSQTSSLSAFAYGDPSFASVLACVQSTFAPFDADVTEVDPGDSAHLEIAVAGTSAAARTARRAC